MKSVSSTRFHCFSKMWVWQLFAISDRPASVMESTFHRGRALRDDLGVSDGGDLGVLVFLGTHGVGRDRYQSGVWAIRPISLMGIFSSHWGRPHPHGTTWVRPYIWANYSSGKLQKCPSLKLWTSGLEDWKEIVDLLMRSNFFITAVGILYKDIQ